MKKLYRIDGIGDDCSGHLFIFSRAYAVWKKHFNEPHYSYPNTQIFFNAINYMEIDMFAYFHQIWLEELDEDYIPGYDGFLTGNMISVNIFQLVYLIWLNQIEWNY